MSPTRRSLKPNPTLEWIILSITFPHIILEVIYALDEIYMNGNESSHSPLSTGIVKSDVVWGTTGGIPKGK